MFAKHNDGNFIIRIEDTDIKRNIAGGEESQIDNLEWLGIVADESPRKPIEKFGKYRQSEKLDRYNSVIDKLIYNGHAYKAYDTPEEIQKQKKEQEKNGIFSFRYDKKWLQISDEEKSKRDTESKFSIRLSLPKNKDYAWRDMVRGKIVINTSDIGDFVIKKQDGFPTYNLAVVVDDHDMEISHVFRGEEHITNTPKQLVIYDLLNWEAPNFAHLTIITNMEGKKLSKRDLATKQFIDDYKRQGFLPEAIFNFLALLGWTPSDASELNSHQKLIEKFDWTRWSKSPSKFDSKKMEWFSKQYFKHTNNNEIIKEIKKRTSIENFQMTWMELFVETYKQSAITISDLVSALEIYKNNEVRNANVSDVLSTFKIELNKNEFSIEGIQTAINATKEITGVKGKLLFMPIRLETTYQEHGPELAKAIFLFGKHLIKKRLNNV